jgi:hypothetical protein
VASGSTPLNPSSARSSSSTTTSMTRTGLSSPIQSSRQSGNSVALPAIRSLNEAPIRSSRKSRETSGSFLHSQGQSRRFWRVRGTSAYPPLADRRADISETLSRARIRNPPALVIGVLLQLDHSSAGREVA